METALGVIWSDDSLRISYSSGTSDVLFVSLTGVGHGMGGIQTEEFVGSTGQHHALFVSDIQRSWYNAPGLVERVARCVKDLKARHAIRRVVTLGNSMGGFGAVLFPAIFQVDVAIALSPQFSVSPSVMPEESRWNHFTEHIGEWRFHSAPECNKNTAYYLFFGSHETELRHARRFSNLSNVRKYILTGDHNVAAAIKVHGQLRAIIGAAASEPQMLANVHILWALWRSGLLAFVPPAPRFLRQKYNQTEPR